jgi:glutamate/tyrosine decarboxylase-like PLP-dependent enzyme
VFRKTLETASHHALAHLESLDRSPVRFTADPQDLRNRLNRLLTEEGVAPEQVIDELAADVEGGILGNAGGRFFGWVVGGSLPAALAADWLTSTWDQIATLYASGPAAAIVEEIAGEWLKQILGLPAHASFAVTTGCQMAHVTCLAVARHALLAQRGWDFEQHGMQGAPRIRIFAGEERHGSIDRALRLLGFGRSQVTYFRDASELDEALSEDPAAPATVLLQAGDINTGEYDPLASLIPLAKKHGAWVHVDGAFGLWAAASPRYRHLVEGVGAADSWATDGHKWLNVPYDCGYAFIADVEAHRAAMSHQASYLVHNTGTRDAFDWTLEWSRRARGFPTYAALRQLGRGGVRRLIEHCCDHARDLVAGIGALPGAEVMWQPIINQGLVRFLDLQPGASDENHDRRTDEVIASIVAEGEAFFSGTTWRGRRAMRVSVCNWLTSDDDVRRALNSVAKVLG